VGAVRGLSPARRERAQLLALDERELHDIGITRLDALNAAHQPFWHGQWRGDPS